MGDLISRSALLELFKSLRDEHETSCISYNALYELILQQKTAYDVEAVVAELEKESFEDSCGRAILLSDAERIVRGKE